MVSSVWIGSKAASVDWRWGGKAETEEFKWVSPGAPGQGVTVSAQAALSQFSRTTRPDPTGLIGEATAVISSYRVVGSANFIPVNAPTLNNVENVYEITFELTVHVDEGGAGCAVAATMVGTVLIQ